MSFWGRQAEHFTRGYDIGERMANARKKRKASKLYQEYQGADEESDDLTESIELDEGLPTGETGSGKELDLSTDWKPRGGLGGPSALEEATGVPEEGGGDAPPMGTTVGTTAEEAIRLPGAREGMGPQARVRTQYNRDPAHHEARFEKRKAYLAAVADIDPDKAMMLEEFFKEKDRKDTAYAMFHAADLIEAGQEQEGIDAMLHAYGMVPDGGRAQVRRGPDGTLVGVAFDNATGEYKNAIALTPDNIRQLAAYQLDPMKGYEMAQQRKVTDSTLATQEVQRRGAEEGILTARQEREQAAASFPDAQKLQKLQIQNAEVLLGNNKFAAEWRDELMELGIKTGNAQLQLLEDRSTLAMAQALYNLNGGRGGKRGFGNLTSAQQVALMKDARVATKGVVEKFANAPDTLEGMYLAAEPMAEPAIMEMAMHIANYNTTIDGAPMTSDQAAKYATRALALEGLAGGKWAPSEDAETEISLEKEIDDVFPSDKNTKGAEAVYMVMDGRPIAIDATIMPNLAARVLKDAEERLKEAKPGSEEHEETTNIIRILGKTVGATISRFGESSTVGDLFGITPPGGYGSWDQIPESERGIGAGVLPDFSDPRYQDDPNAGP